MKILSAQQIRDCDRHTIATQNISSESLMSRAASECAEWLLKNLPHDSRYHFFCGGGNNGGDGLATAYYLHLAGCEVEIFIDRDAAKTSTEFQIFFDDIKKRDQIPVRDFSEAKSLELDKKSVVVDAIFGIGLDRALPQNIAELISFLNTKKCTKMAVDIPTGLLADGGYAENSIIFKADHTLAIQFYKRSFLHPETGKFCGKIHVLDIGLDTGFAEKLPTKNFIIDKEIIREIYRPREDFANKGTFGKACILAGSLGKMGAAVLATKAALRTGCGLTFSAVPGCGTVILQSACPEAMVMVCGENEVEKIEIPDDCTVGIGPGIGTQEKTGQELLSFLKNYKNPLILDADALNIIAKDQENLRLIPKNSVITPHPKEFERLFGITENSFARQDLAKAKASELGIVIVLKDHRTQVVLPDGRVFYNISGNSGMAKGGSGDALTGILTALLAQGYSSENAAIFGVWLHGKSADFAAKKFSKEAMLPKDLISKIGKVFKKIN